MTSQTSTYGLDAAHWQERLDALTAEYEVPGATLGILRLGEDPVFAHSGILNARTGVAVTDDTLFQIGSISKVWTTTLVMQLVDQGLLELDRPIIDYLPEFRSPDDTVTRSVTMRHLLNHTSGIDGDVFTDTGRGDDAIEKYVALLAEVRENHPLGATLSYCNSGFVLAGRVIEKLTGKVWDTALSEMLLAPLGLDHTVTLPEDALLHRAAVGHVNVTEDGPVATSTWMLPRSIGPAGIIVSTAADVLRFAALHLTGGLAADGSRLLSEESVACMQQHEFDLPNRHTSVDSWGVGWMRFDWDGRRVIGHDGNTIGQAAFLRLIPEEGVAVTLLTNGGNTPDLYGDLFAEILDDLAGIRIPTAVTPPDEPYVADVADFVGTYERTGERIEVVASADGLALRSTPTGALAELDAEAPEEEKLVPVSAGVFALRPEGAKRWRSVVFAPLADGTMYMYQGVRATPKTA